MDFLSIRKKAKERAADAERGGEERAAPPPGDPSQPPGSEGGDIAAPPAAGRPEEPPPDADEGEGVGEDEREEPGPPGGGLGPSADGRFATWRPGAGPPPVAPDDLAWGPAPASAPRPAPAPPPPPAEAARAEAALATRAPGPVPPAVPAADPLEGFFYRPDEDAETVPLLGSPLAEEAVDLAPVAIDEFLTFRVGAEEYGVPIDRVREVLRAPPITEVPRAPAHVLGVVTVRGEVVAVVDARRRLGVDAAVPEPAGASGRIVVVDAGEGPLGLLVDAVASVVRLPRGSIEPCPPGVGAAGAEWLTGIGRWRDRLFMVVDVGTLLRRPRRAEGR